MTVLVAPVGVRDKLRVLLEDALPWYDRRAAATRDRLAAAQLEDSRAARATATRTIRAARRDRMAAMRDSYQRADDRLARR